MRFQLENTAIPPVVARLGDISSIFTHNVHSHAVTSSPVLNLLGGPNGEWAPAALPVSFLSVQAHDHRFGVCCLKEPLIATGTQAHAPLFKVRNEGARMRYYSGGRGNPGGGGGGSNSAGLSGSHLIDLRHHM